MQRRLVPNLLMIGLLTVFAVFMVYPIGLTVIGGFQTRDSHGFTLHHVAAVFQDPALCDGLRHSFAIAIGTTLDCLFIALPLAVLSVKFDFPGKKWLTALVLMPMVLPPFVGAIGLSHLQGRFGSLNAMLMKLHLLRDTADLL